jgi:type VI secretion system secreted protein Hcp
LALSFGRQQKASAKASRIFGKVVGQFLIYTVGSNNARCCRCGLELQAGRSKAKAPTIPKAGVRHMPYEYYCTITGSKSGKHKGDILAKEHKDKIRGLALRYGIKSPRDLTTGQASGRRQHFPIEMLKEVGPSSPQIFHSLVTNEVLSSVLFEFVKVSAAGGEAKIYYTIKLTNAAIYEIKLLSPRAAPEGVTLTVDHEYEWVSFTFDKIELNHINPNTVAIDSWRE